MTMTAAAVRHSLREDILGTTPGPVEAVYEFWVPKSNERADVAVIGALMQGFEIKTERDTLKRLPRQTEAYTRVFDRCHAVLAERHVDRALEMLPSWWGVLVIETEPSLSFRELRPAIVNEAVDAEVLVRLLWRDEAHAALCALGDTPDPRAGRFRMWELLLALLDIDGIKKVVREALLRRDPTRAGMPSQRFAVT
jgi:hypothetical protein